jgi:HK97 gp10 family phage protein
MRMGKIKRDVLLAAVSQDRTAKKQMRALAVAIRDEARSLAPVQTGALRRSIIVVNAYDPATKTVTYRVGWNPAVAFYGWMVEAGTEDTPPQPHLRPAARKYGGVPPQGGV